MKLNIVAMVGVIALQFTKAPHWVEYTYAAEGYKVRFISSDAPSFTSVTTTEEKKKVTMITIGVPKNGGLLDLFGDQIPNPKEVGGVIKEAVAAYNTSQLEETKPEII